MNEDMPDKLIGQFTTSSETVGESYFDQYLKTREALYQEMER